MGRGHSCRSRMGSLEDLMNLVNILEQQLAVLIQKWNQTCRMRHQQVSSEANGDESPQVLADQSIKSRRR